MENALNTLWDLALELISLMGKVWEWLTSDLVIELPIQIPILLPDGFVLDFGFPPIYFIGSGLIIMFAWWFFKG